MLERSPLEKKFSSFRIGITGANGELGKALTKKLREEGAFVVGLTHKHVKEEEIKAEGPQEWVKWECGEESALNKTLEKLDILIINHGINPQGRQTPDDLSQALEVNALSSWRLLKHFEKIALRGSEKPQRREIWVNTSEAEIQPALSPGYELSKRLIGQLVSFRWNNLSRSEKEIFKIRKLILGPFRSKLNPIGLMSANWVAKQIIFQAKSGFTLIIVTPNPLTYLLMPLHELCRTIYSKTLKE